MPNTSPPAKMVVLVTIHGMGFQQAPLKDGTPGYADGLHERLSTHLGQDYLSDDPQRAEGGRKRGERGPIYVHSQWPPDSGQVEHGMGRLGSWSSRKDRRVCIEPPDKFGLIEPGRRIAHIALVYADLGDSERHLSALGESVVKAALNLDQYSTLRALVRDRFLDVRSMLWHPAPAPSMGTAGLRVRDNPDPKTSIGAYEAPSTGARPAAHAQASSGPLDVLRQLEEDVITYLARNDHRERVRAFVRDALMRLCFRTDVAAVVVNAHSLGTVVAYDALRSLPPHAACWVRGFVTAGAPIRKLATLFYWGDEVRGIAGMESPGTWLNFWDGRDPVADPIDPPRFWQRGEDLPYPDDDGRYVWPDPNGRLPEPLTVPGFFSALDDGTGQYRSVRVHDRKVDNLTNSQGGGLQAHNYWDNDKEMVRPLADLLRGVVRAVDEAPVG